MLKLREVYDNSPGVLLEIAQKYSFKPSRARWWKRWVAIRVRGILNST
jgi:hypothetical protein